MILINSLFLILSLGLAGISTAGNIDPGLVGWWSFEDGFGSVARDVSGKSVNAEITGNVRPEDWPEWMRSFKD